MDAYTASRSIIILGWDRDGHHGRGSDPAAPQPERFADEREAEIAGRSWIRRDRAC
jgi:hypothetical protein